jgi:hypothetical protein
MIFDFALPAGRDPLATRTISPMSSAAMSRRHYLAGTIKNGRVNVTSTPGALVWYACCTWSSLRVYYLLANCEQIVCLLLPVHYGNAHLSWSNQVRMYCSLFCLSRFYFTHVVCRCLENTSVGVSCKYKFLVVHSCFLHFFIGWILLIYGSAYFLITEASKPDLFHIFGQVIIFIFFPKCCPNCCDFCSPNFCLGAFPPTFEHTLYLSGLPSQLFRPNIPYMLR